MFFPGAAGIILSLPVAATASGEAPSLTAYMIKIGLSVALFAIAGYGVVLWSRRTAPLMAKGTVKVLTSLPLGKDVLFVVRCGPDVIVLTSGGTGTRVIGRWRYEDWIKYEQEDSVQ